MNKTGRMLPLGSFQGHGETGNQQMNRIVSDDAMCCRKQKGGGVVQRQHLESNHQGRLPEKVTLDQRL